MRGRISTSSPFNDLPNKCLNDSFHSRLFKIPLNQIDTSYLYYIKCRCVAYPDVNKMIKRCMWEHTNSSGDPGSFIPLLLSVLPVSETIKALIRLHVLKYIILTTVPCLIATLPPNSKFELKKHSNKIRNDWSHKFTCNTTVRTSAETHSLKVQFEPINC